MQKDVGPNYESQTCGDDKKVSQGCFYTSFCFLRSQESIGQEAPPPDCEVCRRVCTALLENL